MTVSVNQGEYGQILRFNVSEDISTASVTLEFLDKTGTVTTKSATTPASDATLSDGTVFKANEYGQYTVESGLLDNAGLLRVRLVATYSSPAKVLKTQYKRILID